MTQNCPSSACSIRSNELTFVPPTLLAFRKDDPVDAYGVSTPSKKGERPFLWVLDDQELRRVPWDVILALPRA